MSGGEISVSFLSIISLSYKIGEARVPGDNSNIANNGQNKLYDNVIKLDKRDYFSFKEASCLVVALNKITDVYSSQVEKMMSQLESLGMSRPEEIELLESQINDLIRSWHHKIGRLGGASSSLWVVDFDHGNGFYCWQYPDKEIFYKRGYSDSVKNRKRIDVTILDSLSAKLDNNENNSGPDQPQIR